jgi:hypothetical protein
MRRHCFIFKFNLVINTVIPFWKLLDFESLIDFSDSVFCSLLVKNKGVPLHAMEAHGGRGGIAPTHT